MSDYDVFISYSSEDVDIAFEICYLLEQNDLKCWIAPRNIDLSRPYANEIMVGIKSIKVLVLVMSKDSLTSEYVLQEVKNADDYGREILPFKIDKAMPDKEMGYYINHRQWLVAHPNHTEKYIVLIRNVLELCGKYGGGKIDMNLEGFNPKDILKLKNDYPSLILLATPFYWASFIYMGIVGNENLWKIAGVIYLIPSVVCVIFYFQIWGLLFLFYPIFAMFLALFVIFWILAIAHAWIIRDEFLTRKMVSRLLSTNSEVYKGLIEQYSNLR